MAKLSREEVLEIVRVARENITGADIYEGNLGGADISEENFYKIDLSGVYLSKVNLCKANLHEANLCDTNLCDTNLREANLNAANLDGADLRGADLRGANLYRANLSGTILNGADLSGVVLRYTIFGAVDLSRAKGLEAVLHYGPSTIGVDTLFRSRGQIPEVFLRGAGVSDELISYLEKIKTPECLYTPEQLDEWLKNLQKRLTIIRRNLDDRKEVQALHGPLNSPLSLNNEIRELEEEQKAIETQMAEYQRLRTLYYPSGSQVKQ